MCFTPELRDWSTPPARGVPRAFTLVFFSRLAAAGIETPDAGQAPARASVADLPPQSKTDSNLISESPGRGVARGGGSWERFGDTGRRLGSGSVQLRSDSEARRGDSEPGKRGLGSQPVAPLGRSGEPTGHAQAPPVRRVVSTAAVRHTATRSPGPEQRRPGGQLDVSARQACDSRLHMYMYLS